MWSKTNWILIPYVIEKRKVQNYDLHSFCFEIYLHFSSPLHLQIFWCGAYFCGCFTCDSFSGDWWSTWFCWTHDWKPLFQYSIILLHRCNPASVYWRVRAYVHIEIWFLQASWWNEIWEFRTSPRDWREICVFL